MELAGNQSQTAPFTPLEEPPRSKRCFKAWYAMEDGDGEKIKLWNDPWLPTSSSYRFQSPINVLSGEAKVKDLMDEKDGILSS